MLPESKHRDEPFPSSRLTMTLPAMSMRITDCMPSVISRWSTLLPNRPVVLDPGYTTMSSSSLIESASFPASQPSMQPEPAWCGCLRAGCTGTVAVLLPVERLKCNPAMSGNRRFNHSGNDATGSVRLIPFFALGFQVFSMILSTFFSSTLFLTGNSIPTRKNAPVFFQDIARFMGRFVRYFPNSCNC
jgi:hypothetical protein